MSPPQLLSPPPPESKIRNTCITQLFYNETHTQSTEKGSIFLLLTAPIFKKPSTERLRSGLPVSTKTSTLGEENDPEIPLDIQISCLFFHTQYSKVICLVYLGSSFVYHILIRSMVWLFRRRPALGLRRVCLFITFTF